MKIRHLLLPSGITDGIPLLIEARWTPEQAVAVLELLDDLREQIVRNYAPQVQAYYRDDRIQDGRPTDPNSALDDDTF
jgi:hypothetical protein